LAELKESFSAVDSSPHVSQFMPASGIAAMAAHAGFVVVELEEETKVEHYPDVMQLMRALKHIGASNKDAARGRGLMTARRLAQVENYYRYHYAKKLGLPATWQILYMILMKP
jgi:malonyl-CoA O-methyltransferase